MFVERLILFIDQPGDTAKIDPTDIMSLISGYEMFLTYLAKTRRFPLFVST